MGLCGYAAGRYRRANNLSFEDLLQEAALGLCKAISHAGGEELPSSTAALGYIHHQLDDGLRASAPVTVSRREQQAVRALRRRRQAPVASEHDTSAASGTLGADAEARLERYRHTEEVISLDGAGIFRDPGKDPHARVEEREQMRLCHRLLRTLPAVQREILMRRFGVGCTPMPIAQVAEQMGMSPFEVRLGEDDALRALRREVGITPQD